MHQHPIRTLRGFLTPGIMAVLVGTVTWAAAPESSKPEKEVPRLVMKNLRMEGQSASKVAIELPRKKFVPIDADLEAGTWGFSRTPCFQFTYVPQGGLPSTFPDQVFTHPVVETDPCLAFSATVYRGEKQADENIAGGTVGLFGNEVKPWEGKLRFCLSTPDQPGEYTLIFTAYEQKLWKGKPDARSVKLGEQKIIIR